MPRVHSLSIFVRFLGKKKTLRSISQEKGNHLLHPITAKRSCFSHYNLFLGKLTEKLARKVSVNTEASISNCAHAPRASHNTP